MADERKIVIEIRNDATGSSASTSRTTTGSSGTKQTLTDLKQIEATSKNIYELQKNLRNAYKATASATGEVSAKNLEIKKRLEEVNAKVKTFNNLGKEGQNTWGKALSSYQFKFNALGNIISNVVSTATRMLAQLASSVVTVSKDFEFAMSGVKAITMATDEEFKALQNDAIRLGGATLYTAKQVAELQTELAKLGFTTTEIRAATDGVVALAAATGEDLGQSALVAGTIIRGFGLAATDLSRVVDVMSQSFNTSALDLYKFAETMKYVAPIASKVGFSVEEVTTLMAKLADQGIIASQAGTGLRNIMLRLADSNSKLSKAMGGTVNSLPELIIGLEKLKKGGIDATGALKLVDRYSVTAFTALIQASGKLEGMYETLIKNYGISQKMADIRMDNFAGSVEKLSGEWQSFILTINEGNGILRVTVDIIRGLIAGITKIFQSYETASRIAANEDLINFRKSIDKKILDNNDFYWKQTKLATKAYEENIANGVSEVDARKKLNETIVQLKRDQANETRVITEMELSDKLKILEKELPELEKIEKEKIKISDAISTSPGAKQFSAKELERATARLNAKKQEIEDVKKLLEQNDAERIQAIIDAGDSEMDAFSEMSDAQKEKWMEYEKVRIDSMRDGLEKELALNRLKYAELIKNADHYGISTVNIYKNMSDDELEIRNKYFADAIKAEKKFTGDLIKELNKRAEERINKPSKEETELAWEMQFARDLKGVTETEEEEIIKFPKTIWEKLGVTDLTSEQMSALRKGFTFISDQIEALADKEKEMADLRVENSERVVDQLQKDLANEIALNEAGYANNVTLKQKELAQAKVRQAEALRLQEQAVKKQQQLEAMAQAISLITATANIIKNWSAVPLGQALAVVEIAAMWGTFAAAQVQAKKLTQYGEGGEIAGKKHSEGGVPINAEGGEFMVKASAYAKNKELVQAINNEDMSNVYRALNQDLSVSLDDSDTARMLGRHFKDKKKVTYFNGYRVEELGNRRRTIRYAKV